MLTFVCCVYNIDFELACFDLEGRDEEDCSPT